MKRNVKHLGRERSEAGLVRYNLSGQRHAQHRAPVKRTRECNDAAAARVFSGNFYCIFNSFNARREKHRLLWRGTRCDIVEAYRELHINVVGCDLKTGVTKTLELRLDGRDDDGVIVSCIGDSDAGGQVNVTLALDIPNLGVARLVGEYRGLRAHAARGRRFPQSQ